MGALKFIFAVYRRAYSACISAVNSTTIDYQMRGGRNVGVDVIYIFIRRDDSHKTNQMIRQ